MYNCKFHEDPIKTECVILVQISNRGVFSNLENVTLRYIIRSGLCKFQEDPIITE